MKILELTEFSAGICGVWTRVLSESREFAKLGHRVLIFSSDVEKGTEKKVALCETIDGIGVHRFKARGSIFSENVKYWFYSGVGLSGKARRKLMDYNPDVIITHLLHPHSAGIAKMIDGLKVKNPNLKVLIVPHAPFNVNRGKILGVITNLWRELSSLKLSKFDKVIAITNWEVPYLNKMGVPDEQIEYIPNGLPGEYFNLKKTKVARGKDVLFLGRIAPVKDLELLVYAAKLLKDVNFTIVGAAEKEYLSRLQELIVSLKVQNVKILPPVYDLKAKIKLIDEHRMFVLPSKREAMPQALLEAMSRGKIVISSATDGGKELLEHGKNGFLFEIGNYRKLAEMIKRGLKGNKEIEREAARTAEKFSWNILIKRYPFVT